MKLPDGGFLTDENIHAAVVEYLRKRGINVFDVKENGLRGSTDADLLQLAYTQQRIVLTHDSDFGKLVIPNKKPFFGIVYLKPGHIQLHHTISSLDAILDLNSFILLLLLLLRILETILKYGLGIFDFYDHVGILHSGLTIQFLINYLTGSQAHEPIEKLIIDNSISLSPLEYQHQTYLLPSR